MDTDALIPAAPAPAERPPPGADAKILLTMLRNHYQPPSRPPFGVFATEIQAPGSLSRANAVWMPTTVAGGRGTGLDGHEIKVTRQDLRNELDDPGKAEPWAQYCSRWWLVIPSPALLAGLTIPDLWGVLAPPSGRQSRRMTVVKPAPPLTPTDPAAGYERLAAWMLYEAHTRVGAAERVAAAAVAEAAQLRGRVAGLQSGAAAPDDPQMRKVARVLAAVRDRATPGVRVEVSDEVIVAAIAAAAAAARAARTTRSQVDWMVRTLSSILEPVQIIQKDLDAAYRAATDPADASTA